MAVVAIIEVTFKKGPDSLSENRGFLLSTLSATHTRGAKSGMGSSAESLQMHLRLYPQKSID